MQHLHQAEIGQIAVQRSRGPAHVLVDGMQRKLERHAAGGTNPLLDALDQLDVMAIAGCQVGPRLGDADDRPAGGQLLQRHAVVHVAFDAQRRGAWMFGIVKPVTRAQPVGRHAGSLGRHGVSDVNASGVEPRLPGIPPGSRSHILRRPAARARCRAGDSHRC